MQLPKTVEIIEVGPRDGFQNVGPFIETDDKLKTIKKLFAAGVNAMEAVSFVSPKAIPQMRDAADIVAALGRGPYTDRILALVPNKKGADLAVEAGVKRLTVVISASEAHNMNNVRKTPAQSLEELYQIAQAYPGVNIKLSLATVFGCPFKGEVSLEEICFVIDGALGAGVSDICLCDTIGVGNPLQVSDVIAGLRLKYPAIAFSTHFHNTRGLAATNTYVSLLQGITRFETAVAGLGGCPFAPGASGNMATEDLVYMLTELGIGCDVNLSAVIDAASFILERTGVSSDAKINAATANKIFNCSGSR